jgi:hypothetical protein
VIKFQLEKSEKVGGFGDLRIIFTIKKSKKCIKITIIEFEKAEKKTLLYKCGTRIVSHSHHLFALKNIHA